MYDVSSLQLWPRTDCCTGNRNTRWNVFVGLSQDTDFSTPVPNVPAAMAPGTASYTMPMTSPTRGRYVTISRPFVQGDDNILSVSRGCCTHLYAFGVLG